MSQQEKHLDIRKRLLQLPKVKASENFHTKLQARINLDDAKLSSQAIHKKHVLDSKSGFFVKVFNSFGNPWVATAAGFAVIAFIIISVYFIAFRTDTQVIDMEVAAIEETESADETTTSMPESLHEEITEDVKVTDSPPITSTDGTETRRTESQTFTSETYMGRGYTDSHQFTERVSPPETTVTSPTSRGLAPPIGKEKEETKAETPVLSAMPTVLPSEPGTATADEIGSPLKKELKMMNVIDQSGLETLKEKIRNLEK